MDTSHIPAGIVPQHPFISTNFPLIQGGPRQVLRMGDDLPGCEAAYASSLNLLEAIVEEREDGEAKIDDDDRKLIEKCKLFALLSVCLLLTWSPP